MVDEVLEADVRVRRIGRSTAVTQHGKVAADIHKGEFDGGMTLEESLTPINSQEDVPVWKALRLSATPRRPQTPPLGALN